MTRSKILWGLGGVIIGAIATYFVMENIYEKELEQIFEDQEATNKMVLAALDGDETAARLVKGALTNWSKEDDSEDSFTVEDIENISAEVEDKARRRVVKITDAERYNPVANDGQDEFDPSLPVVSEDEESMDEDEAIAMQAIFEQEEIEEMDPSGVHQATNGLPDEDEEQQEDPEQEDDPVNVNIFDGISIIEVAEVQPGRRIVGRFNHQTCEIEISTVMSVRNDILDEFIAEAQIEGLLGVEAENILMNADEPEPSEKDRMLAVRNNIIGLDFAINY